METANSLQKPQHNKQCNQEYWCFPFDTFAVCCDSLIRVLWQVSATEVESSSVSYCTVRVNIADVNDNSPQFSQRSYTFDVSELAGQGEVLTPSTEDIVAVDEDSGFFGNVTYSIQGSQSWSVWHTHPPARSPLSFAHSVCYSGLGIHSREFQLV